MSDHMKRLATPRTWPLKRKISVWVTKQSAGAHALDSSMSAVTVLRDMMHVCDTAREAKRIVGNRDLFVDGKAVKDPKAPIGVMDVITIPKMNLAYRMLYTDKGKLTLVKIDEGEAKFKLAKVEGKTLVKGGKIQLNLSGGRNILVDNNDCKVGDSVKLEVPEQKIVAHYPYKEGALGMVVAGIQAGTVKTIKEVVVVKGSGANTVIFQDGSETVAQNVFVLGDGKSEIALPEASA